MKKSKLIFIVAVLAVISGAFWFATHHRSLPPEPIYEGKTLSLWLSNESVERAMVNRIGLTDEAVQAVRTMGTNAIPYLLATLQCPGTNADAIMKRHRAATGFRALGAAASPAYPKLVSLVLTSPDPVNQNAAINALMTANGEAITLLVQALQSHDEDIRSRAALALYYDREAPNISLPALTATLSDPSAEVRANAVSAIGAYQELAGPLVPQVSALLSDQYEEVKSAATEALRSINLKLAAP